MLDQIGERITGFLGIGGEDPAAAQQEQYRRAMQMLQSYRPRAMQARESGLAHSLSALGPANEYLKQMYGPEFGLDLQALSQPGTANYLTDPASLEAGPSLPSGWSVEGNPNPQQLQQLLGQTEEFLGPKFSKIMGLR